MERIEDIVDKIIESNGDKNKIFNIVRENLVLNTPYWNLRAHISNLGSYPSIDIYLCNEEGDATEKIAFTEVNVENKELVSYAYDLNSDDEDAYGKTVHDAIRG